MRLDTTTEFGARAERRLRQELIIWLTSVSPADTPQPSPVWFLWDGETVLVYSRPDTPKLRNIERHPTVALHLDGNGQGGDIVVLTGEARVVTDVPPANQIPEYVTKYRTAIARIGMSPETFARAYSVAIRVTPTRIHGH
jgi:PPOX class probable F420-dependent enzyme